MIRRRHARRRRSGDGGFSLIEVLVSLVLLALVLSLLTGAVRFARGTWDAAARLDREAGYDAASFTRARLSEAVPLFEHTETGAMRVVFKGASERLSFVAPTPNGPAGAGLYRFVLEVGTTSTTGSSPAFLVKLAPYQPQPNVEMAGPALEEHVLAENVKTVRFRYFGRKDPRAAPEWHAAWPRTDALPDLVEITMVQKGRENAVPLIVELRLGRRA
jgi:general secretion pathway protein J